MWQHAQRAYGVCSAFRGRRSCREVRSRAPLVHACLHCVEGARWASWDASDGSYEALGGSRLDQQWPTATFGPIGEAGARLRRRNGRLRTHAVV